MTDFSEPDANTAIPVVVNGKSYSTHLFGGVQRFDPDPAVLELVDLSMKHFGNYGRPGTPFYHLIPEELKAGHPNAVVRHMVEENRSAYCGLNEVVLALHSGAFAVEDYIEFETFHGLSVGGFVDAVTSQLSNLGLCGSYIDPEDGEEYEDYGEHFSIENPLWED